MRKIISTIVKINQEYYIPFNKQLMDYLGYQENDEIEFEPRKPFKINEDMPILSAGSIKVKLVDTCFNWGVSTLSTKDRKYFPPDRQEFILNIDGQDEVKHVASLKIAMKSFFNQHPELKNKEYISIKIIEPYKKYKLIY
ncbi:MAG: hypothetical protein WCI77_01065 [Candidatus Omnitrophota bacterium]